MGDLGIIYYSSNREDPKFEQRIIDKLLENCGELPIVSVTHKPTNLGKNIVVGDVGTSGFNMFRQVQIALKEIKTKFVISAEADCMYPPDYFTFIPPKEDLCYRNSNLYVMGDHREYWYHKPTGATHAQVIGREFYLETLNKLFEGAPEWCVEEKNFPKERIHQSDFLPANKIEFYKSDNPVFQVKTHRSMRYYTHSNREPIHELPFWGKGTDIRRYLMEGVEEKYVS